MMVYFERLRSSGFVSLEAFKMYYVMHTFAPSLHRKSTDFPVADPEIYKGGFQISTRAKRAANFLRATPTFSCRPHFPSRDLLHTLIMRCIFLSYSW